MSFLGVCFNFTNTSCLMNSLESLFSDESKEEEGKYSTSFEDFNVSHSCAGMIPSLLLNVKYLAPLTEILLYLGSFVCAFVSAGLRRSSK